MPYALCLMPSFSPVLLLAEFLPLQFLPSFFGRVFFFQQFAHPPPGIKPVQTLAAAFLHLHLQPTRSMPEVNTSRCFIHLLPARPAAANESLLQSLLAQAALRHPPPQLLRLFFRHTKINHRILKQPSRSDSAIWNLEFVIPLTFNLPLTLGLEPLSYLQP